MLKTTLRDAPALLTMPHFGGTLAAVRCLGQRGVNVIVASDRAMAPGSWSRHVTRRVRCPSASFGPRAVADWLLSYGREQPGAVLYPTSDDMAWVIARHADELREHFHLLAPPLSAVQSLLDKSRLHEICSGIGVATPATWCPRSEREVAALCRPDRSLLVKPRSQMFCPTGGKGERVSGVEHAKKAWREHRAARHADGVLSAVPDLDLPMLQEYKPAGANGTYSISGFIDRAGQVLHARASTKVLQSPPMVGVGMCFIAAAVDERALAQITAVARAVGYFGTFEVEFVRDGDAWLLIDFNPRYYGQMGFDIARGAPLPWLVQQAALARDGQLQPPGPDTTPPDAPTAYFDRVTLGFRLGMGLLAGSVSWNEAAQWRRFTREANGHGLDGSWRNDDPLPSVVAAASLAWASLRHPRAFVSLLRQGVGQRSGRST